MSRQRSKRTGKFLKIKEGTKTSRMLGVEKYISKLEGRLTTLEEDYMKYYFNGDFGQKKLADRWQIERNRIFRNKIDRKGRGRSWIKILNLPLKNPQEVSYEQKPLSRLCEICEDDAPLEKAHWIPHADGGPKQSWNLINLCGSCHDKFDKRGDKILTLKILKTMLRRELNKIFQGENNFTEQQNKIFDIVQKLVTKGKKHREF